MLFRSEIPERLPRSVATLAVLGVFTWLAASCSFLMKDRIHYVADTQQPPTTTCPAPADPADQILGIGLSGGGSRAAVFGAAALEALSEHGALDAISHVSSVSGGSLPTAYLVAHPPACRDAATETAEQACLHEYFAEMKRQMRHPLERKTMGRNLRPWRFSSPTRRVVSFQEVLDKHFLDGRTFGELPSRPVALFNATSYDETRRFVFSNTCLAADAVPPSAGRPRYRVMAGQALGQRALRAFTFSRPDCPRPTPADLPLSLAVASSAAFPGFLGPVSIQAPATCDGTEPQWWHLGDGGAIDNQGLDSLDEVVLRRLADERTPPPRGILILSIDAGAHPDAEALKRQSNFKMNSDPVKVALVVASPQVKGKAYRDVFWNELAGELAREQIAYQAITLQYTDARLEDAPASCSRKVSDDTTPQDLLRQVETRLKIPDCHADLLELAGHQLIHDALDDETVRRLNRQGFAIQPRRACSMTP